MIIYSRSNDDEIESCLEQVSRVISRTDRYRVLKRQKWKCNNCGRSLKYNKQSFWEGEIANIDHVHPFSLRDSYIHGPENINELENLQALCQKCNKTKHQDMN